MKFKFEAMDNMGQEISEEIEAESTDEAISKCRQLGFFVTKIRKVESAIPMSNENITGCLVVSIVIILIFVFFGGMFLMISNSDKAYRADLVKSETDPACQIRLEATRVLMHLPDKYTFIVKEKDEKLSMVTFDNCEIIWMEDAKPNEPIRVEGFKLMSGGRMWGTKLTVHLHDASEIDGAGWQKRQGKHTVYGNTNVVE
jgi:hypothetical protein